MDTIRLRDLELREGYYMEMRGDIVEHMETLSKYAKDNIVVEFGVRSGASTLAFLDGNPKMLMSYDINVCPNLDEIEKANGKDNFKFTVGDTLNIEIEECDVLFIDTLHNYEQLKNELKLHGSKARKNIIFHDTVTFGYRDMLGDGPGLILAITEFLQENEEWKIKEHFLNNNGLLILEKHA